MHFKFSIIFIAMPSAIKRKIGVMAFIMTDIFLISNF